jgi:putative transposase
MVLPLSGHRSGWEPGGLDAEPRSEIWSSKRFFQQAVEVVGHAPKRVTTDGHDSYPRAIRETLGSEVLHRTNRSLNNRLEQDHHGIKQRNSPMRGFESVAEASCFCRAFDEVRQFFRVRTTMKQQVSLAHQREVFRHQLDALKAMVLVASHRRMRARSTKHVVLLPVYSVLTHPF